MLKRPLVLKIIITFLALAPVGMLAVLLSYDARFYDHLSWQLNSQIALFCIFSLAASYGVFRARAFGFWLFLIFVLGCLLVDMTDVVLHPENRNVGHLIDFVCAVIGVAIVLRKRNRQLFFDKAMRWWERSTRYMVDWPVQVTIGDVKVAGQIQSISHTGCFVAAPCEVPVGSEFQIDLVLDGRNYLYKARVARVSQSPHGLGCYFDHADVKASDELKRALKTMPKAEVASTVPVERKRG